MAGSRSSDVESGERAPGGSAPGGTSSADSLASAGWVRRFVAARGGELFVDVDDDYFGDRFNLTGLAQDVDHYQLALDLIADGGDGRAPPAVLAAARHLYGLIHARYIVTHRGLQKMADKLRREDFGRCPRVLCAGQPVLPVGLSDVPGEGAAKLYCPRCEDVYTPPAKRHARIDGAYFGTTFPHLLFQVFPNLMPARPADRYVPRIFGFRIHEVAVQHRRQDALRDRDSDTGRDGDVGRAGDTGKEGEEKDAGG
ncbi:casein kinase II, regulatory subunit [Hyaloraphidium curvatum]|nr:casein kinase II, regulatory subunit [Hyaloraphidium curvatum]